MARPALPTGIIPSSIKQVMEWLHGQWDDAADKMAFTDGTGDLVLKDAAGARTTLDVHSKAEDDAAFVPAVTVDAAFGDGATDATAHIQARIDYAETLGDGTSHYPDVVLPAGAYRITDTLIIKGGSLRGASHPNTGVRLVWDGVDDGTVVQLDASTPGGFSYKSISRINFRNASGKKAGTWLDLSASSADIFGILELLQFGFCSGDAVKLGRVINCHMRDIRGDGIEGALVKFRPGHLSSFLLERFTYDNYGGVGAAGIGRAVVHIDDTENVTSNGGPVVLRNARIELGSEPAAQSGIVYVEHSGTTGSSIFGIKLEDISFQAIPVEAQGIMYAIYRDTADTSARDSYMLENFRQSGLAGLRGGTWPANEPEFTAANVIPLLSNRPAYFQALDLRPIGIAGGTALRLFRQGETDQRWDLTYDGVMRWGSGTGAADVELSRSANNELRLADGDIFRVQGVYTAPLRMGPYRLWVDATGALRIKNGVPASDTDGDVVGTQT